MTYREPLKDMLFVMKELAGIDALSRWPGFEDAGYDMAGTVLEECARFNEGVLAPLNDVGDKNPSRFDDGRVTATPGFKEAFQQYTEGGWQGLQHPTALGGQGLPKLISAACMEITNAANLSFALCPLLTDGAIEALLVAGTPEQQQTYVPEMISGRWTGTMNLTEPQAGSDLALLRTLAERQDDGTYRIRGTKIFITWGEHDMAENIVHLVLARVPGAPEGVKGISLFLCPKLLEDGRRNGVQCVGIEHKLGIKASPTAVLEFEGAVGYLLGEENRGLEYMFVMMNAARYAVGVQGVAMAERAYQKAVAYARERVQGRPVDGSLKTAATIIHHPDVRRMLMTMRAYTEGCRAVAFVAAAAHDASHAHPDAATRRRGLLTYEFLVPLVKGLSTEVAVEVASLGIQVHGGTGYIEESGAPQFLRDARILSIYEGTTAIQANDLVGRKTLRDRGETARVIAAEIEACQGALREQGGPAALTVARRLDAARRAFLDVVGFVVANARENPNAVFAGSVPYLLLAGQLVAGWQMARALLAAERRLLEGEDAFLRAKIVTARFFADHILSQTPALRDRVLEGASSITDMPLEAF
ncbi:MAG: acyl-CoA dehydrogenase [Myxococcales bacterium]